jgi:hypothetical protein
MKVFFDFEFTGLHQKTTAISLGLIAENERAFYAEFPDYDRSQVNDWIQRNVIDGLWATTLKYNEIPYSQAREVETAAAVTLLDYARKDIVYYLGRWLRSFKEPVEMWGDVLAYDWVLFCELWGGAFNIPDCVYYIPFDVSTLMKAKGIDPDINREIFVGNASVLTAKHNALHDAKVTKACYEKLMEDNDNGPQRTND